MDKGQLQEQLVRLYLRLNGYFITSYIAHSPNPGRARTELDVLAVRFPFHSEAERLIGDDPHLHLSDERLDLAICEVKSLGQQLRFNKALYESEEAVASVLYRSGVFRPDVVPSLVAPVQSLLTPQPQPSPVIPCLVVNPGVQVRALLFSPERDNPPRSNQPWFVCGRKTLDFITRCLCPAIPRQTCATNYGAGQWGDLKDLVSFFKENGSHPLTSVKALFESFGAQ